MSSSERGPRVLIADHLPARRREIHRAIQDLAPAVTHAPHTSTALECLEQEAIDAVITTLDVDGLGGIELCRQLKNSAGSERIPVLILAGETDAASEIPALEAGADAFLMRPLNTRAFRARLGACVRQKSMLDSLDETEKVVVSLAHTVEGRDPALGLHCERLSLIAVAMGVQMGLPNSAILSLQRGGHLHDVGKVAIPDNVLLKPGPLTPEEWAVMKTHPVQGEKICSSLRSLKPVLPIIRHHHERWDGSGYPDGLKGEEIPLLARIVQFADIYDALTADRPYKRAFTSLQALDIMRAEAAKGWRDPHLMRIFESVVPLFAGRDNTAASLQALAEAIGHCRQRQPIPAAHLIIEAFSPATLMSGL